jgi:hypothetical protein
VDCGKPKDTPKKVIKSSRPLEPSVLILFISAVVIILIGAHTSELEIFDDLSQAD